MCFQLFHYFKILLDQYLITGLCCIFQQVFECCTLQMLVGISIINVFNDKKLKNEKMCCKIKLETVFLKFAPKRWPYVLLPEKNFDQFRCKLICVFSSFYHKKTLKMNISTRVWSVQHLSAG